LLRVEINEPHKYHAYRSSEERLYVKHRSSSSSSSSSNTSNTSNTSSSSSSSGITKDEK